MKSFSLLALSVIALVVAEGGAFAQGYPNKAIRFVVPLSAGAADTLARTIGAKLTESWGQQVVVENRPGAGTTIGTDLVAKAAADGYTLLMATFSHAVNATFYRKLPYDTLRDFATVTLVASAPNVLVVHPSIPATSVREFIALARSRPGELNFASAGNGSSSHLAGELFKSLAGISMLHVPYKGAAPAMTDLLGGHVHLTFDPLPSSLPHVKAGKLRALGVTSAKRSAAIPELATIAEAGVAGYEISGWSGVLVAAGTPKEIVTQLNAEIVKILNIPEVKERFSGLGFETVGNAPEQFDAFIRAEINKWGKVVRDANIYAD